MRMTRTFGAPSGALIRGILSGVESLYVSPITPLKGGSGRGSTSCAITGQASAAETTLARSQRVTVIAVAGARLLSSNVIFKRVRLVSPTLAYARSVRFSGVGGSGQKFAPGHSRHSRHPSVSGLPQELTFGQCPCL